MIMSEQILTSGADHRYAAAQDWIKQTAATRKALPPPGEKEPAGAGELAGALLPAVPGEHVTAIVAYHIRETLSATGPARGAAPAGPETSRYADPYSARCPDCDNPAGAAAEARQLLGRWAE